MSSIVSSINGSSSAGANSAADAATQTANSSNQTLTQQDFLQIMVAQFEDQDPLSSSDGSGGSGTSDYVSQLISMTNLTTLQTMSGEQADQVASQLPGETVELDNNGAAVTGVVQSTSLSNGAVSVNINGQAYPISDLVGIAPTASQAAAASGNGSSTGTTSTTPTTN